MNQTVLLALMAVAALVIFSGRASAVLSWFNSLTKGKEVSGELGMVANLVEAAKTIQDAEQRAKVREACMACFVGWLKSQLPE